MTELLPSEFEMMGNPVPVASSGWASALQAQVLRRAVEVFGDKAEAIDWMRTPIRALEYARPDSLLITPEGCDAILTVLGRLEHGVL